MAKDKIESIPLDQIIIDQSIQSRNRIDQEAVSDYARTIQTNPKLMPPCVVFLIDEKYYLVEGFHRIEAYDAANSKTMPCIIETGTREEAILHSAGANIANGVHRTADDKRRAVHMLLDLPEWAKKSARLVAAAANVSHELVSRMKDELAAKGQPGPASVVSKDGTVRAATKKKISLKQQKAEAGQKQSAAAETAITEIAAPKKAVVDRAGNEIARPATQEIFGQDELFADARANTKSLKQQLVELSEEKCGAFLKAAVIDEVIGAVYKALDHARPYADCPNCKGKPVPSCAACKGAGFVTKFIFDAVAEETKAAVASPKKKVKGLARTDPKNLMANRRKKNPAMPKKLVYNVKEAAEFQKMLAKQKKQSLTKPARSALTTTGRKPKSKKPLPKKKSTPKR
jgi:hypothetical protein